jgi:hypothetical protein
MKTNIVVNLEFEGLHHWPDAIAEAYYLKNAHRHLFKVCCKKEVSDDNRQIEFINFKRDISYYISSTFKVVYGCIDLGAMSCEMLAKELVVQFKLDYCCVMEDGENGAEVIV